jgi:hypothetical protein
MFDQIPLDMDDGQREKLVSWTWKQVGDAYAKGYADGQCDASFAQELTSHPEVDVSSA